MACRRSGPCRLAITALGSVAFLLWGCSSEILQPNDMTPAGEGPDGEVSVEPIYAGIPTPSGLGVRAVNAACLCVTWNRTTEPYLMHIGLDGVQVAETDARAGVFTQVVGKFAGDHYYQVCYGRGCRTGTAARIYFHIDAEAPNPVTVTRVEQVP